MASKIVYIVPNQKVIIVRHDICDETHLYTKCNVSSNKKALKELSPNTYKLYMYFALNQDGYTFALSYQDVYNVIGMSDKTYQKAVRELIEKEYLVQSETSKGLYIFYDGTISSPDRKVETTQQTELILPTDNKKELPKKVRKGGFRREETTGEILQDNTLNNTINITEGKTASPQNSSASQEPIKKKYDGRVIPFPDGTPSEYKTDVFDLTKRSRYYTGYDVWYRDLTEPLGHYRFDKKFVSDWMASDYGYIAPEEAELPCIPLEEDNTYMCDESDLPFA